MSIKVTWTFAPTEAYPRHSEGAFERVNDREIVFFYCRFHGGRGDNAACDLARCVSRNEGESWSEPETVLNASLFGTENVMSVSLIRMLNGDLGCVYLVKQTPAYNRIFLSRSRDGSAALIRSSSPTHSLILASRWSMVSSTDLAANRSPSSNLPPSARSISSRVCL